MTVIVMVPAHNEEADIARTLASLAGQTRPADRVIVVADNCTDRTAEISIANGAEVFATVGNTFRKSGAQTQALAPFLPGRGAGDVVISMDADVMLEPEFIANSVAHLGRENVGAVSVQHLIENPTSLVELMQVAEYERDRRYIGRKGGKVGCMSGMGTAFRVSALKQLVTQRGYVYDKDNWTEDWELTFALRGNGWLCMRPQNLRGTTVPVPTWRALFVQRERWGRGYFQTISKLGLRRITLEPWAAQAFS